MLSGRDIYMKTKVTIAGATGSVGSALVAAICRGDEFELVSAVARKSAGKNLGKVLNLPLIDIEISKSVEDALRAKPDVFIDYGKPKYVQAPSGTAREMADAMGDIKKPSPFVPPDEALGLKEARGATVSGAQVHSIRSPGFGFSVESIFGLPGERLVLRHDASESAEPYVYGTLLAAKSIHSFVGLKRGIDSLLFKE